MNKTSMIYLFPNLYIWSLKRIRKNNSNKRYQYIASLVNKSDQVLEPGCGPCLLANLLPDRSNYQGFDANPAFTRYTKKRHPTVFAGDILDPANYREADVVVLCDELQHIHPKDRSKMIANCYQSAKKLFILCDSGKKSNLISRSWLKFRKWIGKDSTNEINLDYCLDKDQLSNEIVNGFGSIPSSTKREMTEIGDDLIAIFYKQEDIWEEQSRRKLVTAIIPVFNEEKTVPRVIDTLLEHPLVDEIVCINDGSTDTSIHIINQYKDKIKIIDLVGNHGKGYALSKGIYEASGEIVAFIDADLINLSGKHIDDLLTPITRHMYRGVTGYSTSRKHFAFNPFKVLTGERAYYRADLLPHLDEMAKTRFGVEIFLNNLFKGEDIKKVQLNHLKGLFKYQKRTLPNTFNEYYNEGIEILRELIRQV